MSASPAAGATGASSKIENVLDIDESDSDVRDNGDSENESENDDSAADFQVEEHFATAGELAAEIEELDEQRKSFNTNKSSSSSSSSYKLSSYEQTPAGVETPASGDSFCAAQAQSAAASSTELQSTPSETEESAEPIKRLVRRLIIRSKPTHPLQITIGPRNGKRDIRPFLFAIFLKPKSTKKRNHKGAAPNTTNSSAAAGPLPPGSLVSSSSSALSLLSSASTSSSSSSSLCDHATGSVSNNRKLGFVSRRVLIDTGARRSAITEEVARLLHLQEHGRRLIKGGTGHSQHRPTVTIAVAVYAADHSISLVEMEASVRKSFKHCLLGSDWIYAAAPQFVIGKQKRLKLKAAASQADHCCTISHSQSPNVSESETINFKLGKEQIAALHSLLLNGKKIIRRPNGTKLYERKAENARKGKRRNNTKTSAKMANNRADSPTRSSPLPPLEQSLSNQQNMP